MRRIQENIDTQMEGKRRKLREEAEKKAKRTRNESD